VTSRPVNNDRYVTLTSVLILVIANAISHTVGHVTLYDMLRCGTCHTAFKSSIVIIKAAQINLGSI